jgi:alpha-glucuronidase
LPNPSIQQFEQDVKHYGDAGILGVSTESCSALATTFVNLYLRGRPMWDPDANVKALIDDFYQKFFGSAAKPMAEYWNITLDARPKGE